MTSQKDLEQNMDLKREYESICTLYHVLLNQNKILQNVQKSTSDVLHSSLQQFQTNASELYHTCSNFSSSVEQFYECYQDMSAYLEGRKQQVHEYLNPPISATSSAPQESKSKNSSSQKPNTRRNSKKKHSSKKNNSSSTTNSSSSNAATTTTSSSTHKRTNKEVTLTEVEIELARALTEKKRKVIE